MSTEEDPPPNGATERFQVLRGRLTRSTDDRIVAGLAGGIAARLAIPTVFVRAGFITLTLAGGFGIICYLAGWLTVPDEQQYGSMITADRPPTTPQQVGLGLGFLALLIILDTVGLSLAPPTPAAALLWPLVRNPGSTIRAGDGTGRQRTGAASLRIQVERLCRTGRAPETLQNPRPCRKRLTQYMSPPVLRMRRFPSIGACAVCSKGFRNATAAVSAAGLARVM